MKDDRGNCPKLGWYCWGKDCEWWDKEEKSCYKISQLKALKRIAELLKQVKVSVAK